MRNDDVTRREMVRLIAGGAMAPFAALAATSLAKAGDALPNGFSRSKQKLESGQDVVWWINSDSTGWSGGRITPHLKLFARWLATLYPKHRVEYVLWQEWQPRDTTHGTGPRQWREVEILQPGDGASPPVFRLYNAALPGSGPAAMMTVSREAAVTLPGAPDLLLVNHGHNVRNTPFDAEGQGMLFAAIGNAQRVFPDTPMVSLVQNPWRDDDGMDRVARWYRHLADHEPGHTVLDLQRRWLDAGKPKDWYRDNVHPNQAGHDQMLLDLQAAWMATRAGPYRYEPWTARVGANLLANPGFQDWTGAEPARWQRSSAALLVSKETALKAPGRPWSAALTATEANAALTQQVRLSAEHGDMPISLAVLVYEPDGEQEPKPRMVVQLGHTQGDWETSGAFQTVLGRWSWRVVAGKRTRAAPDRVSCNLFRTLPVPGNAATHPAYVQSAVMTLTPAPCGA